MALKPNLSYDDLIDAKKYEEYSKNNYLYLGIYLALVMLIQFVVNASVISTTCGGSISENIGAAGVLTFIPWSLIFGVVIIILIIYPGFKSAFSDVIGYFYVSGPATKIITELLVNRDVEKKLTGNESKEEKEALEDAADTIVKICGNTSILINQIVPDNFQEYWKILNPLKKPQYRDDNSAETKDIRQQLFELVVTKDNIGEALWYIYTGILLTSIVQLKITTRGCNTNTATMEKNYNDFLKKEEEAKAKKDEANSTVYTITS
jgi:UPF0716 family protein affecting phage T7 exclusion